MKKATKSVTTPATPAPEPAKPKKSAPGTKAAAVPSIEKPAPKKKAPAKKKVAEVAPVAAAPEAAPKPAPAPVAKAPEKVVVTTSITAQIDVGFGNALYIRGDGPGLSWEKGVLMDCIADDRWSYVLTDAERPVVFKFLLNDITWSAGEDFVANPGSSEVVTPSF